MTADHREKIKSIFCQAADLDPAARQAFLDEACGGDDAMRAEIDSLLAVEGNAPGAFMHAPAFQLDEDDADGRGQPMSIVPDRIGGYTILRKIGAGGMGYVYEARQDRPSRTVAIKLIRTVLATPDVLRRFDREAHVLGQLQHPGIATIYETGTADLVTPAGTTMPQPFIAMERIHGQPLTVFVRDGALEPHRVLELFTQVCDAVHHAHERGIIHRDLKPGNILVNQDGAPKILDFGVARLTDADARATTIHTDAGKLVGTLPYMSPEQVRGHSDQIDGRADVYSLGVVLYELLAERLPLDLQGRTILEAVQIIQEVDPTRLGSIDRSLRGDIETIVEKALEKDPTRRYASAAALAADIRRFLNNEPIIARPATTWYQVQKFTRRNKGLMIGAAVAMIALMAGLVIAVSQAMVATNAQSLAEAREQLSVRAAYRANISAASTALANHDIALARRSLNGIPEALRNWEWRYLSNALDHSVATIVLPLNEEVRVLAWLQDQDGVSVAARLGNRNFQWRVNDGANLTNEPTSLSSDWPGLPNILENAVWQAIPGMPIDDIDQLLVSKNRRFVVWTSGDLVHRRDLQSGNEQSVQTDDANTEIDSLDLADDGRVVFAAAVDGEPALWPMHAEFLVPIRNVDGFVRSVAFNPNGDRIAAGLQDTTIQIWNSRSLEVLGIARGHQHAVSDVAFSPDGSTLASVSLDRTLRLWEASTLAPRTVLHGHTRGIARAAYSPDGNYLATAADDGTIRVWDARTRIEPGVLTGHAGIVYPVVFSPDGSLLASAGWDRTIRVWDPSTHEPIASLSVDAEVVSALAISPGNRRLAAATDAGYYAWDLATSEPAPRLGPTDPSRSDAFPVRAIDFDRSGQYIVLPTALDNGTVRVWNTSTGATEAWDRRRLRDWDGQIVSPDGRYLVLAEVNPEAETDLRGSRSDSGALLAVIDMDSGRRTALPPLSGPFAFSPTIENGACLAARLANDRSRIGIWNLDSGKPLAELTGHAGEVYSIAYSPDATRMATAGRDALRLWDAQRAEEIMELRGHRSFVWSVVFSPDGRRLASGSGDGTVRIWDTQPPTNDTDAIRHP